MATETTSQNVLQNCVDNIAKLDAQKMKAITQLKAFCSEIHQQVDRLESSLREELDLTTVRHKSKLQEQIEELEELEKRGSQKSTKDGDKSVKDVPNSFKEISVELVLDRNITKMMTSLGKVEVNEVQTTKVIPAKNSKCKEHKMGDTIFRVIGEIKLQRNCGHVYAPVHGTFLPDDNIIFAVPFAPNGQLLVYNQKGEQLKQINLTSFPHSVAVLSPSLICVTIQFTKCLEFRDIETLYLKKNVEFSESVSGVAVIGENLVVACEKVGFLIVNNVGKTLKTIRAPVNIGYLAYVDNNILYIESGVDKLFCFNCSSGEKLFEVEMKFGNVKGITTLGDKSILVSMFRNGKNNIARISADGSKQVKQTEFSSLSWPSAVGYDHKTGKLFLAHGNDLVSIYVEK